MRHSFKFAVSGVLLATAGCASVPADNITACTNALLSANTSNPATLLAVAASTPACQALAQDIIQSIISKVGAQQRARGLR